MYLQILSEEEQKTVVRALRGPQFDRKQHGGLWDRGTADSYYGRMPNPHWMSNTVVTDLTPAEIEEYLAGYAWNERHGDKKEWR